MEVIWTIAGLTSFGAPVHGAEHGAPTEPGANCIDARRRRTDQGVCPMPPPKQGGEGEDSEGARNEDLISCWWLWLLFVNHT